MPDQSDHTSAVDQPGDQSSDFLLEGMLLVEELSIDGMCGVY
jgi:mycofactocin precursor